jgi:hypothetical protein
MIKKFILGLTVTCWSLLIIIYTSSFWLPIVSWIFHFIAEKILFNEKIPIILVEIGFVIAFVIFCYKIGDNIHRLGKDRKFKMDIRRQFKKSKKSGELPTPSIFWW